MSSRERFEAWASEWGWMNQHHQFAALEAWKARDAEVAQLVEALREARIFFAGPERSLQMIDALLREYDEKEKRDGLS